MAYTRIEESGTYIYSDSEYIHFLLDKVPEDYINIFLYKLVTNHKKEFNHRLELGEALIKQHKTLNKEYYNNG